MNTEMVVAWEAADLSQEAKTVRTVLGSTLNWVSYLDVRAHVGMEVSAERIFGALEELVSKNWAQVETTDGEKKWTGSRPEGVY